MTGYNVIESTSSGINTLFDLFLWNSLNFRKFSEPYFYSDSDMLIDFNFGLIKINKKTDDSI
jgi:hypothetical protein